MIARNDFGDEHEYDRARKANKRATARDLEIPPCANPERRAALEASDEEWLRYYYAHRFFNQFTDAHREIISDFQELVEHGGDKAVADQRGGGKTTIVKGLATKYVFTGRLRFPVIIGANGVEARAILDDIKNEIESNDCLCEDYPEICVPIRALDRWAARARKQTVKGEPTNIKWSEDKIVLPTVPGSRASGACIQIRGMDAAIRGMNERGMRPDFALLDDAETTESAASDVEIEKRERKIERDVAFLGGPNRRIARMMLCTIGNRKCLAFKYTDPKQKPSWGGRRYRQLVEKPKEHDGKWLDYMNKLRAGQELGTDPEGNEARQLYLDNREVMDEGAIIGNPYRYDSQRGEVSALQACYNLIARTSWDSFCTEMQNDPPEEDGLENSGITSSLVASRISGLELQELPHEFKSLVHFIDLGHHYCYWGDSAWQTECIGTILDYGALDVHGITKDSDQAALERALLKTLHEWRSMLLGKYKNHEGQVRNPDLCLVDSGSGLHTKAVYEFCRQVGAPFYPSKGFDKSVWRAPAKAVRTGDHWAKVPQPGGAQLYEFDATYWKQFAHQRFLTPTFDAEHRPKPGSLSLFICPELEQYRKERREFTHQAVAEIWGVAKPGGKPGWIGHKKNHYQDVTAGLCLAASVTGIELIPTSRPMKPRVPLNQMAGRKSA